MIVDEYTISPQYANKIIRIYSNCKTYQIVVYRFNNSYLNTTVFKRKTLNDFVYFHSLDEFLDHLPNNVQIDFIWNIDQIKNILN